ncbi:anti-sigma factor domain-containing protein [Allokutzneria sp. NRRL B-24872]|uniref:anti-sigma factor n=1 Tax=Allokutzneria sp. NRRL B-24872 TaxID=1137961 RepID=UPI000A36051B|nr:anti-sigma factor [Allokutzneria sp. NRRL B-24872]
MNPDVHTLTGAYAMNALDEIERREFERHMAVCPDCEQETRELERTAAHLGMATATAPPPGLRSKVLAEVSRTRQLSPIAPPAAVVQKLRPKWAMPVVSLLAAASVLAAVVFGVGALTANQELTRERALAEQVTAIVGAADARTEVAGNSKIVSSKALGKAVFLASDQVPAPRPGNDLQAWSISDTGYVSLGLMERTHSGKHAPMVFPTSGISKIGVTLEPSGGSVQPTSTPLLIVPVA